MATKITPAPREHTVARSMGLGFITGAADDDCSAIGTYAQAGAQFGYSLLWTAPITLPMMVAIVYLSGKLGQVTGQGLFAILRSRSPRWLLYIILSGVITGNIIEAGADIGAMSAAIGIFVHIPAAIIIVGVALAALVLQIWGSYTLIRDVLRVLALSLCAYIFSAFLAHPSFAQVARGSLIPRLHLDRDSLAILVAIIGTSLSAYLYTWQSNEEVEEKKAAGQRTLGRRRRTTTPASLKSSLWDVIFGMLFSNVVMYFIILAAAATLYSAGIHHIESAADAARALRPVAGNFAGLFFALGIIGVGFLAVPVMTTGAAYDLCQSLEWRSGLSNRISEAKPFYVAITAFTLAAMALNFVGINPMHALVLAGIVQGFSTPPLMLLIMIITNRRSVMRDHVNGLALNVLGWITTIVIFAASAALVTSWIRG